MSYEVAHTLASYDAVPHVKPQSVRHIPCADVAAAYELYKQHAGLRDPETEAVDFYALNHLAAAIRKRHSSIDVLPEWADKIMEKHNANMMAISKRMFFYLLLICTRESRHLNSSYMPESWVLKMKNQFGSKSWDFNAKVHGSSSNGAVETFLNHPPSLELGMYADSLVYVFNQGKFSASFGGPKWGKVAETLASFVSGQTSAEMMVDTAFTLAHNNGPIFNKGMLFKMYGSSLIRILDVQRSGQMPEGIHSGEIDDASEGVKKLVELAMVNMPNEFGTYIDWFKVEQLGSVQKYSAQKKLQVAKYGTPATAGKSKGGQQVTGSLEIWPGQVVTIVKRKKAA